MGKTTKEAVVGERWIWNNPGSSKAIWEILEINKHFTFKTKCIWSEEGSYAPDIPGTITELGFDPELPWRHLPNQNSPT